MRIFLIAILILFYQLPVAACTESDSLQQLPSRPFLRDLRFVALPVLFRLPETRWGGGVVGTTTFSFGRDSTGSKPSQLSFGLTFTQNRQILAFVPFSIFYDNDRFYFNGDNGWYKYNYFYYGLGEERVEEERFDVTYPRIRLLAAQRVYPSTYLGIRYQFESYRVTGTQPGGELASGRIEGSDYSRTSSLGPSLLRDTRDQVFYPRKGMFGELYLLTTAPIFGADRRFVRFYIDVANYFSLSKRLVLATNYVGSAVLGRCIPFSQLSTLGGSKKMRGVYENFFRDKHSLLAQAEFRWEVWRFLGLTSFGSLGFLGNEHDIIRLGKPKYTYGFGLRINAQKKNHLNIRLDYGLSPYGAGNFYATIGEAF